MKLVYIAGKYRGPTAWDIAENVRRAEQFGLVLARYGGAPVIPHSMNAHFQGQLTDEFWLESMLLLLSRCDAIFLIPGWEESSGAKTEKRFAESVGLPVFEYKDVWTEGRHPSHAFPWSLLEWLDPAKRENSP